MRTRYLCGCAHARALGEWKIVAPQERHERAGHVCMQGAYFMSREKIGGLVQFPVQGLDMAGRVIGPQGALARARAARV